MSLTPWFAPAGPAALGLLGQTALAGFTLVNGTPQILTWTAPADGKLHRVHLFGQQHVTGLMAGGQVTASAQIPDGTTQQLILSAGALSAGFYSYSPADLIVAPGGTVTVSQSSALTLGAAVTWLEMWGL